MFFYNNSEKNKYMGYEELYLHWYRTGFQISFFFVFKEMEDQGDEYHVIWIILLTFNLFLLLVKKISMYGCFYKYNAICMQKKN